MPTGATALTIPAVSGPAGPTWAEQTMDAGNGNKFVNDGGTMLFIRNTTAGAIIVDFYFDLLGVELKCMSRSVPGSGTANGCVVLGPFPPNIFNDHKTTTASGADQGMVVMKQASAGSMICEPFVINKSILG